MNQQIAHKLLGNVIKPPTAIDTWMNIFPFLETKDWHIIFLRTFKITQETYIQSFQYKIINRIINWSDELYNLKIKSYNECDECGEVDSIEHYLCYCKTSTNFFNQFKEWMVDSLGFIIGLITQLIIVIFTSGWSDKQVTLN